MGTVGACDFLRRKFTSLYFPLVLLALIGQSDFYFHKVTRTRVLLLSYNLFIRHYLLLGKKSLEMQSTVK
jgi:hypothetical protein